MKFKPGDTASVTKTITQDDIEKFAELSGDRNSIHLDQNYAKGTRFRGCIAHGMLTSSLISNVIGNELPGLGSIYLSQNLKFVAPVFPADTITARVTVTSVRPDKPIVTLTTVCTNQRGEAVVKGEAVVLVE
ncbi:MAG: MaoC family dehydratase [Pyrinomonadaceae bacterium]